MRAHRWLVLAAALPLVACGPQKPVTGPVPNALDHRVEWYGADVRPGRDATGRDVDEIPVRGGDVVRLTIDARGDETGPLEIGERVRSGAGFAETWTKLTPENGRLIVRTTVLGVAILAPRGTVRRAHLGLGHDPGYDWFALEDVALAWAEGPLPAPFPAIAPPERIDFAAFDRLDRVLARAVEHAKDADEARASAIAIRRVVALRAVRAIRPNDGFPYFYDDWVAPDGLDKKKEREIVDGKKAWLIAPDDPMVLTVEGPRVLLISTYGVRDDDDQRVTITVREGKDVRARSGGEVPGEKGGPATSAEEDGEAKALPLRRALVHVPPGKHTYRVEAKGGSVFAALQLSKPVVHIGDAFHGVKDEERLLRAAKATSEGTLLTLANALAATDGPLDGLSKDARDVAIDLAEGGPHDPLIALETRAANGDEKALAALGEAARHVIDDGVRGAWLRGTTRGTHWVVADGKDLREGRRWLSLIVPTGGDALQPGCTKVAGQPWTEIDEGDAKYAASMWRGANTVHLMAAASCSAQGPMVLDVDGERLSVSPSSSLSRLHVLVRHEVASIKRLDKGEGKVWGIRPEAASCGAHWGFIGAPRVAKESPALSWNPTTTAPGVEVWLREGSERTELELVSKVDAKKHVTVRVRRQEGFVALDDHGTRWTRAARLGLPVWAAAEGVVAMGGADAAVRAIVRAPKSAPDVAGQPTATPDAQAAAEAEALDEEKLIALSRAINGSSGLIRAKFQLERALLLARAGEVRAAMEDARAAKLLGAQTDDGEDVVVLVRSALRAKARRPLELPEGVKAYGIEPEFDPAAARCVASTGPRGKLASIVDELKTAKIAQTKVWDPELALRAYEAVTDNAIDPRGASVLSWALAGSRWQVPRAVDGATLKVQRPHDVGGPTGKDGPVDPDGDLRARIATGMPFDRASYAIISEGRPAKVALTGSYGQKARIEIACVPRSPADALDYSKCPIAVTLGDGTTLHPEVGPDGKGSVELPALPQKGAAAAATIALGPAPGRFVAVARAVFDGEVPGTTKVLGVGWVVMPDGLQWRWLVKSGEELKTKLAGPGLLRIDARREPDESANVVVVVDGKERPIAVDGAPKLIAVPHGGTVIVRSVGGASTISIAERVAKPAVPDMLAADEQEADPELAEPAEEPTGVTSPAYLDAGDLRARWRDVVAKSPRPLTPLEEALGTVTLRSLVRYGTYRDGDPRTDAPDHYFEEALGYRRRIESIDLWTGLTGIYRPREGNDSWGASMFLYKTINPLRLRIAGWADLYGQKIGLIDARTVHPHGYVELSGRVTPSFFILPRVGYDGYYSNLVEPPSDLTHIDDDVFNNFRFRRPTLLYGQVLTWWVPYFNSILWTRTRASFDTDTTSLSHVSFRPGGFFALDRFELDVFGEATWFAATEGLRAESKVNYTGAAYVFYNTWFGYGSVDIQPGIGGRARANDGAWEVFAVFNVLASFQRGLRDFASPELNFPEQFGGSVAWRGFVPGGMR